MNAVEDLMNDYTNTVTNKSLTLKLWRGERMCLLGMDVTKPEADFVGFSIEVKSPGSPGFIPLRNRLAFSYPPATEPSTIDSKQFSSLQAPFQKFRWVHFPQNVQPGQYSYRVTKQHMPKDGVVKPGDSATATISLDPQLYSGFLDVGFTRGYASSQAFTEKFGNTPKFFPPNRPAGGGAGPTFDKSSAPAGAYQWLGFEAYDLIFGILNDVATDTTLSLDAFAYDLDEPDIIAGFAKIGKRLRIIIDNSGNHAPATSGPSQAAKTLTKAKATVQRMHFKSLQHNKVLIVKRNGTPVKVLCGSTNFSFNGLYLQSNNTLVFEGPDAAGLFEQYFTAASDDPTNFPTSDLATKWHLIQPKDAPAVQFCLAPHGNPDLSLNPVAAAIDQATSSVFFAIAFLAQTKTSDTVRAAVDRLIDKPVFSYGISDKSTGLSVKKPDGTVGLIGWNYLKASTAPPFTAEFNSGSGIHEHNKFVVTDFNLPTAKVFTGSSNLSESGESKNGDHLIMIADPRVATSYAIQAILIFDHLHFAANMNAVKKPTQLVLQKPIAFSKAKATWFARFYEEDSQLARDRELFSH
jgi:phosphatidylserine/phosphatidylglycerophosphate/cardiolipin synthase-like enzyme